MTARSKITMVLAAAVLAAGVVIVSFLSGETSKPEPAPLAMLDGNRPIATTDTMQKEAQISRSVPSDPRLAALAISKDNGFIRFIPDPDGRIIKEIDTDPNSIGYTKPLREYTYADGKVIALSAYHYYPDGTNVTRIMVSYKPDGSVDQYRESSEFIEAERKSRR